MTRMVEKRASTVDDATAAALDELGATRDQVEIEVLSEGRRGLFAGRSRAHVRVTMRDSESNGEVDAVTETAVASTVQSTDGEVIADDHDSADAEVHSPEAVAEPDVAEPRTSAQLDDGADETEASSDRLTELNEEADLAADFVEGLLDILELPGDIEIEVDESQAFVNVVEVGSGLLIGRRGATLEALQELVRAATQRQIERRSHVRIDIEGYRQRQLEKMKDRCRDGIAQVRETGEPYRLEPMDAYERKVMHDLVGKTGGVTSASEGVEPRRRVVVYAVEE